MAEFSEDYFKGEEREGVYVEEMMKRAWAAQIEVLEMIDCICQKYNIEYFADWGTLLGAVRHKGFVPWDDDMDITMKRADYNRFIAVANTELPEASFLHSIYTDENYNELFARVVNSHHVNFTEEYLKRWHGCPYIVGVDIFPLDNLPKDAEEEKMQCDLLRILLKLLKEYFEKKGDAEQIIKQVEEVCGVTFDYTKNIKNQFLRVIDSIRQIYDEDGGDYTQLTQYIFTKEYRMPLKCYSETIWMPFETIKVPVPKEYDIVLRSMYGDYQKPVRKISHDYPFYKKQQEIVDRRMKEK